ncbi:PAS sensor protein [Defluviimonas sp. 20V17]|uniref:histidine kinase n=1 Tax=Allgaiera indica TaxID=765699 RepID=A0AAN4URB7_9RHOB|nr:PAS-domain containing protein [Allgaiera indica]KDB02633.1 PAS sensor protein [Defluviimonas sp. 20V17]GHE01707.1 signal transduction histidine kinase [Allgaiera indica]SDW95177.1 PAS fold-containing protein [Allgaiera indica]
MPEAGVEMTAMLTRAGLNLIQQALSIFDSDLRLAVSNRAYKEMFDLPDFLCTPGASFEETIGYLVHRGEYGPVDDVEEAVRSRVDTARAFVPHYLERTRANGRTISVEGAPLPQGGWVTVYTDITEIKHQEALLRARSAELSDQLLTHAERLGQANRALAATNAALEEAKRELTETEARIRLTAEMTPAHIAHMDLDLRYTYSNRRLATVLPERPASIIGLTGREALGDDTFARIEPSLHRALAGEANVFEFTDGTSGRRIRVAFTPDRIDGGPINGVYILSTDVTKEAQSRAALVQTRKRELAAQLTSGLAHDFANLLTVILGLQARLARLDLPGDGAELVAATHAAARRGGLLLDRIAGISGRRKLRPVATDLPAFLRDLRVLAAPTLPENVTLGITAGGLEAPVLVDQGTLQDALVNLILNARDAIGGAAGRITLHARPVRDTWIEITTDDTGPGFTPEALEHALDPFFSTKGAEGSGLGLSMVYDQAKLAGGEVRLANRPEGGAHVTLRLPLRLAGDAPATAAAAPGLVLLVEDREDIRTSVREMLREMGHAVIEAGSVDEALTIADLPEIALILSDIGLPGARNGVDLMEVLATRGARVRRLLMTSLPAADPQRRRAAALGVAVLAKPFDAAQLSAFLAAEAPHE